MPCRQKDCGLNPGIPHGPRSLPEITGCDPKTKNKVRTLNPRATLKAKWFLKIIYTQRANRGRDGEKACEKDLNYRG